MVWEWNTDTNDWEYIESSDCNTPIEKLELGRNASALLLPPTETSEHEEETEEVVNKQDGEWKWNPDQEEWVWEESQQIEEQETLPGEWIWQEDTQEWYWLTPYAAAAYTASLSVLAVSQLMLILDSDSLYCSESSLSLKSPLTPLKSRIPVHVSRAPNTQQSKPSPPVSVQFSEPSVKSQPSQVKQNIRLWEAKTRAAREKRVAKEESPPTEGVVNDTLEKEIVQLRNDNNKQQQREQQLQNQINSLQDQMDFVLGRGNKQNKQKHTTEDNQQQADPQLKSTRELQLEQEVLNLKNQMSYLINDRTVVYPTTVKLEEPDPHIEVKSNKVSDGPAVSRTAAPLWGNEPTKNFFNGVHYNPKSAMRYARSQRFNDPTTPRGVLY